MISARTRFLIAPVAGVALAASVAACSSSGGGNAPGPGTGSGSGSSGVQAFCDFVQTNASIFEGGALKGSDKAKAEQIVSESPSEIKGAFQTFVSYLEKPTTPTPANVKQAALQIKNWGKSNCAGASGK